MLQQSEIEQPDFDPTKDSLRFIAEVLHIMRPISHRIFKFKKSFFQNALYLPIKF
jgi:hypothetical protein